MGDAQPQIRERVITASGRSSDVFKPGGRPSDAFRPISATGRPSDAFRPISATGRPSDAFRPISATGRPSDAFRPASSTGRPSDAFRPISATGRPSDAFKPASATSQPSDAFKPASSTGRPTDVLKALADTGRINIVPEGGQKVAPGKQHPVVTHRAVSVGEEDQSVFFYDSKENCNDTALDSDPSCTRPQGRKVSMADDVKVIYADGEESVTMLSSETDPPGPSEVMKKKKQPKAVRNVRHVTADGAPHYECKTQ